jgi:hypothetical protein
LSRFNADGDSLFCVLGLNLKRRHLDEKGSRWSGAARAPSVQPEALLGAQYIG